MKVTIGRKFVSLVLALLLISTGLAPVGLTPIKAAEYDLTTDTSVQQVEIEGAIWTKLASSDPTGSGIFESFLRVQKDDVEKGYNTDYRPLQFDENSSAQFTRSFKLADVPQVKIGETIYREFQLDINQQSSSDPEWYISLDKFQVWLTDNPELHGYDTSTWGFPSGAVKVYDLGDNSIKLDYRTNPGSGKRDYRVLVPESMFAGKTGEYVVLFTQNGATFEANDGYEEWGVAIKNALIEGYKWNDMNGDGVWDAAEPGLNGWTINLSGAVSTSTLTHYDDSGKAGYYSFSVAPGSYTVSEVEQAAWMQTYPVGDSYSVTAGNGAVISGLNFGNMQPLPGISVTKTGDQLSKAGDEVTYTVEIENTGNVALTFDSVIDTLKGDITSNFTSPLGVGEAASYSYTYTVPDGAADPLLNEVAVNAHMVDHAEIATSGSSSHSVELFQPSFEITKSGPSVVMIGSMVTYTYTIKNNSSIDSPKLVLEAINDDVLGDLSSYAPANLNPGEEVTFTAEYKVTVAGTLTNVVTATYGVEGFPNKLVDSAEHTLFVADPNTVVTATAYTWETYPGGNVSVTIMERNTGNIDLENVSVSVFDGINTAVLDCHSVGFSGDDGNCILNKGETWSWAYQVTVYADTTYVVTGYGEVVGLEGVVVTYPAYPSEQTTFKVKVVGTTRTQGFWKTHTDFTKYVFENYAGSYIDLGWKKITNIEDLMGMFWADNAKKSDGHKRSQLDQARMIASQQAIAAVLNSFLPGGAPLPGGLTPAAIATIMGGTDVKAIKDLGSTLGSYNESGDGFALDPSLLPTGKATPNFSRQIANIPFAD
ncbi:MAG TPA: hypothetical protein DCR68_00490 [Coprothermobacter sp.]|nr:hypothetical protein [Coprothermobacter sp.]